MDKGVESRSERRPSPQHGRRVGQAALQEVFDRFDVVGGLTLNGRQLGHFGGPKPLHDAAQVVTLAGRQFRQAGEGAPVDQMLEPGDFDLEAGAVERGLRQVVGQGRDDGRVAAVEGAEGRPGLKGGE
jgi:hypothetical protein